LVLGELHQPDHSLDVLPRVAAVHELLGVEVLLDVGLADGVEAVVRRQRLVGALLAAQLGRRRPPQHGASHELAALTLVPPPGPRASTATSATRAESIPPESPSTTRSKPFFST